MSSKLYDYKKIKKQILAEAELHKTFGIKKVITFCLNEIFNQNIEALYDFLTSDEGGFETYEVFRGLYKINHYKYKYKKVISGLQPF